MSHEKNFVSELVQMAKAFEELPLVQASLSESRQQVTEQSITISNLEMRIIDLKNDLDSAHSATRKAEVERDHAETMFLETDQKLDKLRGICSYFSLEVAGFVRASEPEPVAEEVIPTQEEINQWLRDNPMPQPKAEEGASADPLPAVTADQSQTAASMTEPTAAPTILIEAAPLPLAPAGLPEQPSPVTPATSTDTVLSSTSPEGAGLSGNTGEPTDFNSLLAPQGERASDPTASAQSSDSGDSAISSGATTTENVSPSETTEHSSPLDDVGYHNEPPSGSAWLDWYDRMHARYGTEFPSR